MIAFMKVDHNFEKTLPAAELFPMLTWEGWGDDCNIVATIFTWVEEFRIYCVELGEALIDWEY